MFYVCKLHILATNLSCVNLNATERNAFIYTHATDSTTQLERKIATCSQIFFLPQHLRCNIIVI